MEPSQHLAMLTPQEFAAFELCGRRRRWPAGATLFSEGDRSDWVAALISGRVKVSSFTELGTEVVLAIREPGALLGELSALDEQPRSATVTALEPVEALAVPVGEFTRFLETHPGAAYRLLKLLSGRLRDADRKRVEFGSHDTLGRVARRLMELAERFGEPAPGGIRISIPLSQQELAGWAGSSREAVAKALRTMRDRGWIETRRREITVTDLDALRRRAR